MPAVSEKQRMDRGKASYIAGFFDGEGYVTIRRSNKYRGGSPSYRVFIGFTNTNREILLWIQGELGGTIYNKAKASELHSEAFELCLFRNDSIDLFLNEIAPLSKIKGDRLKIASELRSLGPMQRKGEWPKFVPVEGEIEKRENLKQRLHIVNKRGQVAS